MLDAINEVRLYTNYGLVSLSYNMHAKFRSIDAPLGFDGSSLSCMTAPILACQLLSWVGGYIMPPVRLRLVTLHSYSCNTTVVVVVRFLP